MIIRNITMLTLLSTLTACAYLQGRTSDHDSLCQQLRGQIVMDGATANRTANPRQLDQQRAGKANLERTYRAEGCE